MTARADWRSPMTRDRDRAPWDPANLGALLHAAVAVPPNTAASVGAATAGSRSYSASVAGSPYKAPALDLPAARPRRHPSSAAASAVATAPVPLELQLRAAAAIVRCCRSIDGGPAQVAAAHGKLLPDWLAFVAAGDNATSGTPASARLREHCLDAATVLLGADPALDAALAHHAAWLGDVVAPALHAAEFVVVHAAARFLRRVVEDPTLAPAVIFHEALFERAVALYGSSRDPEVVAQVQYALLAATGHPALHFMLSRCQRLLAALLADIQLAATLDADTAGQPGGDPDDPGLQLALADFAASPRPTPRTDSSLHPARPLLVPAAARVALALRALANLLGFPGNAGEVQRLCPGLVDAALRARKCRAAPAVAEAANTAVQLLHDLDEEGLAAALACETAPGRAVADRLRSPLLDPAASVMRAASAPALDATVLSPTRAPLPPRLAHSPPPALVLQGGAVPEISGASIERLLRTTQLPAGIESERRPSVARDDAGPHHSRAFARPL